MSHAAMLAERCEGCGTGYVSAVLDDDMRVCARCARAALDEEAER